MSKNGIETGPKVKLPTDEGKSAFDEAATGTAKERSLVDDRKKGPTSDGPLRITF